MTSELNHQDKILEPTRRNSIVDASHIKMSGRESCAADLLIVT